MILIFTMHEIQEGVEALKVRKTAGLDGIFPEFIKYPGKHTLIWLVSFYNDVLNTSRMP